MPLRLARALLYVACFSASVAVAQVEDDNGQPLPEPGVPPRSEQIDAATLDTARTGGFLPGTFSDIPPDTLAPVAPPPPDTGRNFFGKIFQDVYPNPERAAAMSLVLPGAGQVYNRKFWWLKVPVIYGGYTGLILAGEYNRKKSNELYAVYKRRLNDTLPNPPNYDFYERASDNGVKVARDQTEKRYQLAYIGIVLLHLVQTLEAYTTAHLLEFDMDESLTVYPTLVPQPGPGGPYGMGAAPGIGVRVALGR